MHEREGTGGRAEAGPAADLDALFRDRFAPMVRLAALMTGSAAEAEEIVMDAFARLAGRRDGVSDLDEPAAYLRRMVVNGVHSRHRRLRTARSVTPPPPSAAADPEVDELWARLAKLSPDQRRCLALRFYEDLTVAQIAEVLGMAEGTVKSNLHRGVAALRSIVAEEDR